MPTGVDVMPLGAAVMLTGAHFMLSGVAVIFLGVVLMLSGVALMLITFVMKRTYFLLLGSVLGDVCGDSRVCCCVALVAGHKTKQRLGCETQTRAEVWFNRQV